MVAGTVALTGVPVVGADAVLQGVGLAVEGGRAQQCLRLRIGTEGACRPGWAAQVWLHAPAAGQDSLWLVDTQGQVAPRAVQEAMGALFGQAFAAEPVEGMHPARDSYGPMVLVSGPACLRGAVERWVEVRHRITVEAGDWEIFPATLYRVGS
eukprot:2264862-Alexandrium_andersonii.AAC.1